MGFSLAKTQSTPRVSAHYSMLRVLGVFAREPFPQSSEVGRQDERTQMRTWIVDRGPQRLREDVARFLGSDHRVDKTACGSIPRIQLLLVFRAHAVDLRLQLGIRLS